MARPGERPTEAPARAWRAGRVMPVLPGLVILPARRAAQRTVLAVLAVATTLAALTVLVVAGGSGRAGAQVANDRGVRVVVDRVIGSGAGPNAALITVTSTRPLRGRLVVQIAGSSAFEESVGIELATGGERSVWLPVVDPSLGYASEVRLEEPGVVHEAVRPLAPVLPSLQVSAVVGVLPSLHDDRPAGDTSAFADGQGAAQLVALDVDDLAAGPWLLGALDVIAGTGADLAKTSRDDRAALLTWVREGGELLLDDDAPLASLPLSGDQTAVGRGFVRRTHGVLATGPWRSVLLPHERSEQTLTGLALPDGLLQRAVRPPRVAALLIGLGLYALLVAPAVFRPLRRRQPLLVWVAAPLAGVVASVVVLGAGTLARRRNHDQQVVVFETGPGRPTASVDRVVTSSRTVALHAGWEASVASATPFGFYGGTNGATRFEQGSLTEPPIVRTTLLAGGAAVLALHGPVETKDVPTTIAVDASYDGRSVTGTVRNTGSREVDAVAVTSFGLRADIGPLPPGATRPFSLHVDPAALNLPARGRTPSRGPRSADLDAAISTARRGGATESEGLVTAIGIVAGAWPSPVGGPAPSVTAVATTSAVRGLTRLVNIAPSFGLFRAVVGTGPATFRLTDAGSYTMDGDQHPYRTVLPADAVRAGSAVVALDLWAAARAKAGTASASPAAVRP